MASRFHRPIGLLLAAVALIVPPSTADEPQIDVQLSHTQVAVGGSVILTIELQGFSGGARPELPSLEGLDFYDAGRSTNFALVNGRFSRSTTYSYQLLARREGTYEIGPITVTDKGRAYEAGPVTLRVAGRATAPSAAPGQRSAPGDIGQASASDGLFARLTVEPREAYVDQQVIARFRLYRRVDLPLAGVRDFQPPQTEGFWREDLGPEQNYTVEIDGQTYVVTELAWALFPTQEGELEIGPAALTAYVERRSRTRRDIFSDFFDRDFFGRGLFDQQPVPLRADPVRLRVRPLPVEDRPAGFTGSVGEYQVAATVDAAEAREGEPLALTVTVRGRGHIQTIGPPIWPDWDGLRVYDSGDAVSVEKHEDRIEGQKQFTQVLVPTRTGELSLAPVRFAFFDPREERYRTIATDPLRIRVLPATDDPFAESGGAIGSAGEEILYIRTDLLGTLAPGEGSRLGWGWLLHLVPILILAAAGWTRRRRAALLQDPARGRRARALRNARSALRRIDPVAPPAETARAVRDLLERYLSDWLGREVRGMRRGELSGTLRTLGVSDAALRETATLLEWSDAVRFGAGGSGDPAGRLRALEALLPRLEAALRNEGREGRI